MKRALTILASIRPHVGSPLRTALASRSGTATWARSCANLPLPTACKSSLLAQDFKHGFASNGLDRSVIMVDAKTIKALEAIRYTHVNPRRRQLTSSKLEEITFDSRGAVPSSATGTTMRCTCSGHAHVGGQRRVVAAFPARGQRLSNAACARSTT